MEGAIYMLGLGGHCTAGGFDLQAKGARDSVRKVKDDSDTGYQATSGWGVVNLVSN